MKPNEKYYHVSGYSDLNVLTPRVPEGAVNTYEDTVIPRICFSTTIDGCLSALEAGEGEYYVYAPESDINAYIPSVNEVRDAKFTGEVWALEEVRVKYIGSILVRNCDEKERHNSGRGRVTICHYPYEWI